jgi:hypothetical protein
MITSAKAHELTSRISELQYKIAMARKQNAKIQNEINLYKNMKSSDVERAKKKVARFDGWMKNLQTAGIDGKHNIGELKATCAKNLMDFVDALEQIPRSGGDVQYILKTLKMGLKCIEDMKSCADEAKRFGMKFLEQKWNLDESQDANHLFFTARVILEAMVEETFLTSTLDKDVLIGLDLMNPSFAHKSEVQNKIFDNMVEESLIYTTALMNISKTAQAVCSVMEEDPKFSTQVTRTRRYLSLVKKLNLRADPVFGMMNTLKEQDLRDIDDEKGLVVYSPLDGTQGIDSFETRSFWSVLGAVDE